jgi:hypothetical protein
MMAVAKNAVPKELLDSLLADYRKPEDLIGEHGLLKELTKLLVEKALEAEMADHLGHGKNEPVENPAGNTRNGKSKKTLKGEFGELPIKIPRDRHGTFEPQLIPKHQTRWTGFDDKIRIDAVRLIAPTGVGLAVDGLDVELPHQCADMLAADFMAFQFEHVAQHARPGKRMFQVKLSTMKQWSKRVNWIFQFTLLVLLHARHNAVAPLT